MSRPEDRPILPHASPMSNFSFAPPNMGVGDNKKNYVFVDEHNRHKRLKVMRACEGCRRRKIKCDAATTNSWPCAACVRLKLQCVPPTVNYNRQQDGSQGSGLEHVLDFADSDASGDEGYGPPGIMHQSYPSLTSNGGYSGNMMGYGHPAFSQTINAMPLSAGHGTFASQATFPPSQQLPSSGGNMPNLERSNSWPNDEASPTNLSDMLGELKIDEKGLAPYIAQQKKTLAEAPAVEESDFNIPTGPVQPGASVRIPPELMPDDETALEYLDIFFQNIYPYMPVISKPFFYQQWHTNRSSISPLLLEAIFACAGRLSDDAGQGIPWLALATKHESSFMDVPRLSTVQGMLLLLKAREGNPKRGYYYRSWISIQNISSMAKDLELDEHYAIHQAGESCGSDETECIVKTRIWQTIFISELMIGGPQGRYDMSVDPESVDINPHATPPGGDEDEYETSRNYTYLARALKNVRSMSDTYRKLRRNKDWASDPRIAAHNPVFTKWLEEIPPNMQIHFPPDGSAPWIPSHFAGNLHCYYHLSILILHRPQLMACSFEHDSNWKQLMTTCYESAKALCRVQEAILQQYGINGFLVMQRGVNFAIYAVLTCTMIHLTAVTSPESEFNADAKDYFVRHMRILEQCITAWPMRDLQAQVQSLREAFSANINKPFELKPTFPFGSPGTRFATSPNSESHFADQRLMPGAQELKPGMSFSQTTPITPPISAGIESQSMMQQGQRSQQGATSHAIGDEMGQWNPSRLFDQWNTAFGTPTSTVSGGHLQNPGSPSAMYSPTASTVGSGGDMGDLSGQSPQHFGVPSTMPSAAQMQAASASFAQQHPQQYVSPSMWQDTVASTYVSNDLKRRWDAVSGNGWNGNDHQQVARPRPRSDPVYA